MASSLFFTHFFQIVRVPEPVKDTASGAIKGFSHRRRLSCLLMHSQWRGERAERRRSVLSSGTTTSGRTCSVLVKRIHAHVETVWTKCETEFETAHCNFCIYYQNI